MPSRTTITKEQVEAAYSVSKNVWHGQIDSREGATELSQVHKMNKTSAGYLISNFRGMMAGKELQHTMNPYATDYFLKNINKDFGKNALRLAIEALQKHVEYYKKFRGAKQTDIRKIIEQHKTMLGDEPLESLEGVQSKLEKDIAAAWSDSLLNRKKKLHAFPVRPEKVFVKTEVYIRNPYVVVEVLERANGLCERCKKQAPFLRAKNGEPYLEVHHIIQLANGGEDTVDNAQGLCPNCHRELHHGKINT